MRTFILALGTIVGLLWGINASASTSDITGTGNEMISFCVASNYQAENMDWEVCMAEVYGIWKGFDDGRIYGIEQAVGGVNNKNFPSKKSHLSALLNETPYCIPSAVTRQQMALVVTKYLEQHPELLNRSDLTLENRAFEQAWPCHTQGAVGR